MADNKKKKTDFSTGLKAAAEKLRPKGSEVVTVMIGDVPTPIARSDMDDATWENVVKQSVKAVPSKVDGAPEQGAEAEASVLHDQAKAPRGGEAPVEDVKKSIDWPRLMSLGQNLDQMDKSLVSDEEKGHLRGMSEWSRAEFLRERMRKHGYEVPQTTAEAERESLKKEAVVEGTPKATPKDVVEPPPSRDDKFDNLSPEASIRGNPASKSNPFGGVAEMVTGALPPSGNPMLDALGQKVAPTEGGFPGASNPAPMTGGFPGASNPAPMEGGFPGVAPIVEGAKRLGGAFADAARGPPNGALGGAEAPINFDGPMAPINAMSADEMDAQEAIARQDPGVDSIGPVNPTPPPAGTPEIPGVPPPGGGSASLSASFAGGGGFTPAKVDPAAIATQKQAADEAMQSQRDAQTRIQSESENQRKITEEATKIELDTRQKADVLGALATQSQMDAVKNAESWSAARQSAAQTARDAAANPIDPNRYWNDKGEGQRAAAVIAGALYGFSGQGMQWLQRIDGLVDADNRLQASDRASKVEGLNKYAAEMGAQADDAMKFGLSRAQAQLLARTQKLEGLKSQLDILTMRQTDAARAQQGAMMSATLGQHIEQIASQGLSLAQQQAQMTSADRYHNAQLAMERMGLQVKAAAAEASAGDKFDPQQLSRLEAIDKALAAAQKARDAVKNTGWTDSLMQTITAPLRVAGMEGAAGAVAPESTQKSAVAASNQETVLKGVMGEALQEADVQRNKPRFAMPGLGSKNTGWLDEQEDVLRQERNAIIENARRAGRNVGSLSATPPKVQFTPSAGK